MTLEELLELLAPGVTHLPEETIEKALEYAAQFRPACLAPHLQDEAQVLYAAWLLYNRASQQSGAPINATSRKEGDLSLGFSSSAEAQDPMGFLGRYNALADLCKVAGGITVGTRFPQRIKHGRR